MTQTEITVMHSEISSKVADMLREYYSLPELGIESIGQLPEYSTWMNVFLKGCLYGIERSELEYKQIITSNHLN